MRWRISSAPWLELGVGLLGALAVSAAIRCSREHSASAARMTKPAEPAEPESYVPASPAEPPERRFYPSTEAGIQIPNFESREWARKRRSVLLEFQREIITEKYGPLLYWAHVDDDGTVWEYEYTLRSSFHQERCNAWLYPAHSAARDACLNANSRLVARLSGERLAELLGAIAKLGSGGRVGYVEGRYDTYLTVRGRGSGGEPRVLAACRWADGFQLDTREAKVIIELFRRLRNGVGLRPPCRYYGQDIGPEVVPGIPGWWTR